MIKVRIIQATSKGYINLIPLNREAEHYVEVVKGKIGWLTVKQKINASILPSKPNGSQPIT